MFRSCAFAISTRQQPNINMNWYHQNIYLFIQNHHIKTKKYRLKQWSAAFLFSFGEAVFVNYEIVHSHFSDFALFWFVLIYPNNFMSVLFSDVISCLFDPIKPFSHRRRERKSKPYVHLQVPLFWPDIRDCRDSFFSMAIITEYMVLLNYHVRCWSQGSNFGRGDPCFPG